MASKVALFLGRPQTVDGENTGDGKYRTTAYDFGNWRSTPTSFFGVALVRYLEHIGHSPDELLVMGSSGSNWDALHELADWSGDDGLWRQFELEKAAAEKRVTPEQVREVEEMLGDFRNNIVHGSTPSDKKSRDLLEKPQRARSFLGQALTTAEDLVYDLRGNDKLRSEVQQEVLELPRPVSSYWPRELTRTNFNFSKRSSKFSSGRCRLHNASSVRRELARRSSLSSSEIR